MADQRSLFYNRRRRGLRFRRVGLGLADAIVAPGTGIASPVTVAEGQALGSLLSEFECLGGVTTGTLIDTTDAQVVLGATDVTITAGAINASAAHGLPTSGFHVVTAAFDPVNNRAKVYVDGRLVVDATGAFTAWASASTWTYANALTNEGQVRDLEVFIAQVPAVF